MPLFFIEDSDRPMYVLAADWQNAIESWKALIAEEGEYHVGDVVDEPIGIKRIANENEIIITDRGVSWKK